MAPAPEPQVGSVPDPIAEAAPEAVQAHGGDGGLAAQPMVIDTESSVAPRDTSSVPEQVAPPEGGRAAAHPEEAVPFVREFSQEELFDAAETRKSPLAPALADPGAHEPYNPDFPLLHVSGFEAALGEASSSAMTRTVPVVSSEGPLDFYWSGFPELRELPVGEMYPSEPTRWGGPPLTLGEMPGGPAAAVVDDRPEVLEWRTHEQIRQWAAEGLARIGETITGRLAEVDAVSILMAIPCCMSFVLAS